eukprot:CAMPEP_0176304616 /NCGR_PEP_ID=MMETSP0121_2-20121125/62522_1 /TAXON_ID=160619 /ORGANISM="Kryptoperidinium foliaceum, Strain CCMP 1326" /LENGTH=83 /DNA_ID=CAMNT_0017646227 /DNA_START=10 /DNA_END=261 /DNA_ORIENTATION=+
MSHTPSMRCHDGCSRIGVKPSVRPPEYRAMRDRTAAVNMRRIFGRLPLLYASAVALGSDHDSTEDVSMSLGMLYGANFSPPAL